MTDTASQISWRGAPLLKFVGKVWLWDKVMINADKRVESKMVIWLAFNFLKLEASIFWFFAKILIIFFFTSFHFLNPSPLVAYINTCLLMCSTSLMVIDHGLYTSLSVWLSMRVSADLLFVFDNWFSLHFLVGCVPISKQWLSRLFDIWGQTSSRSW